MEGVRLLQRRGYPFHVIAVLTRASLTAADEIFDFFVSNGVTDVGFNIEEVEGANQTSSLQRMADVGRDVRVFFARLAELCPLRPGALTIRELVGAAAAIVDPSAPSFGNQQTDALRILSVGANGDLSTFSPELLGTPSDEFANFAFGNIEDGGVTAMLSNDAFLRAERAIAHGVAVCRATCVYFDQCLGGAPANKFFEHGDLAAGETLYCRLTKQAVVDVVLTQLERDLALI
jgi:uncharacterized protein